MGKGMANQHWLTRGLITAALVVFAAAVPGFASPVQGYHSSAEIVKETGGVSAPSAVRGLENEAVEPPDQRQSTPAMHMPDAYDRVGGAADTGVHMGAPVGPDDGAPPAPENEELPRPANSQNAIESRAAGDVEQPDAELPETSGAGGDDIAPAPRPEIQQPEIQRPEIETPTVQTPDIQRPEISRPDN